LEVTADVLLILLCIGDTIMYWALVVKSTAANYTD
jgi:hypothetical protein